LKSSNKYGIKNREKSGYRPVIVNHEDERATLKGDSNNETSIVRSHYQREETAGTNSEINEGAGVNDQSERATLNVGSNVETNDPPRVSESIAFNNGINHEINGCDSVDSVEYDSLVVGGGVENSLGEENEENEAKKWYEQNFNRSL
jgi:hypothetical protein